MKKILIISAVCGLCVLLTACNSNTQSQHQTGNRTSNAAQTTNNNSAQATYNDNSVETNRDETTNLPQSQSAASTNSKPSNSDASQPDNQSHSQSDNDVYTFEYHDNTMPLDDMILAYEAPADIIKIDENATDPSNKDILFEYDDLGRIVRCSYTVNGVDFFQGYTYSDTEVQIYSFCGATIVDDAVFSYTYDANIGFTEINGYYFNNIKVN